jgi:outer membrane protein TolC
MLAALLVIGCEVGPNYQAPKTPEPAAFSQAETRPTTEPATTQLAEIPTPQQLQRWWEMFNDPELNILIARGVKNNLDLKVAKERVIEARAQLGIANAGLFPTIDATGEYSHSRRSKNLGSSGGGISTGTTGTTGTTTTGGGGAGNPVSDFYQAGFDATWEIDVFGGVRRGVEAAQANVESQVDNQQSVLITLLGDVATDYVQLRGLQKQVAITEENIGTQKQSLALIQTKNRAGLVADLDVTQQTAQVLTTQAELPDLEAQIAAGDRTGDAGGGTVAAGADTVWPAACAAGIAVGIGAAAAGHPVRGAGAGRVERQHRRGGGGFVSQVFADRGAGG